MQSHGPGRVCSRESSFTAGGLRWVLQNKVSEQSVRANGSPAAQKNLELEAVWWTRGCGGGERTALSR